MYLCSDKLKHLAKEKQTEKKMLDEAAMPEGDETYMCMYVCMYANKNKQGESHDNFS